MKFIKYLFKTIRFFLIMLIFGLIGLYIYAFTSPVLDIKNANQLYIYDDQNNLVYQGSGNSEWIDLEEVSPDLINAIICTEDKNFYNHNGFDYLRIVKAMVMNIQSGKIIQGASTISQQYIKNMFLDFDKTWDRKWDEALLTLRLETQYDKNQILEGYLNTINFGQGNYGIENASRFYFNKSAKDLTLEESLILAGIPKSPNYYNPVTNYDESVERAKLIGNVMLNNGYISDHEYDELFLHKLNIYGKKDKNDLKMLMYYQDAVYDELKSIKTLPSSLIESGGIKIYTSLNMDAQKTMEEMILKDMGSSNMQVASVIINPNTGGVMALSGGMDYAKSQYNRATDSYRQVGSSIKPLLYYSALENGMVSSSTFLSEPTTFVFSSNKTYTPSNYNEKYGNKNITMTAAISYSDNIYAVKTHLFLGEDVLVNTAKRMGIKKQLSALPSLALGTCELSMLDFANAYATLASGGYKRETFFINRIEDMDGNIIYERKIEDNYVLNESYTYILNEMMTSTYDANFIDYNTPTVMSIASKINGKYAVKTGSSGSDCWMIGYDKNMLMMVWNGYDNNDVLEVKDGMISKNIWADTMRVVNTNATWYDTPNNVVGLPLNPITGETPKEGEKSSIFYFLYGSELHNHDTEFVYKEKTTATMS